MQFNPAIYRAFRAIDMDALMRAIPACNVAEVATDAFLLVDMRNDLVIQIQVLPFGDASTESPRKSSNVAKPLVRIQFSRPSAMSSTIR